MVCRSAVSCDNAVANTRSAVLRHGRLKDGGRPVSTRQTASRLPCLPRGIAAVNGKGGTLKTSTVANMAGLCAAAGYKTLVIDLDPQGDGNLGTDLGYNALGLTDKGRSLAMALAFDAPPTILREVRPNLDVICGGKELEKAVPTLMTMSADVSRFRLLQVLAPFAADYNLVFIDTPPGNKVLQEMALTTVRYAYIPTRSDSASIDEGVGHIAESFAAVKTESNPDLTLLGAIITATTFRGETEKEDKDGQMQTVPATARFVRVRERIEAILGQAAPVYRTHVRYVEAAADDARDGGQLAHELEQEVLNGPSWKDILRNPDLKGQRLASSNSAGGLASDYQRATQETLAYVLAAEGRVNA